jgi:hypothetical protein
LRHCGLSSAPGEVVHAEAERTTIGKRRAAGAIAGVILVCGTPVLAQTAQLRIDEVVVLDNDSIPVALRLPLRRARTEGPY